MELCDILRDKLLTTATLVHPATQQKYILLGENHVTTATLPKHEKYQLIEQIVQYARANSSRLWLETHERQLNDLRLYQQSGYEVGHVEHHHVLPLLAEKASSLPIVHFDIRHDISQVFASDLDVLNHVLAASSRDMILTTIDTLFLQPCSIYLLKNREEYSTELLELFRDSFDNMTSLAHIGASEIYYFLFQMPAIITDSYVASLLESNSTTNNIIYAGNYHIENLYKELISRGFVPEVA